MKYKVWVQIEQFEDEDDDPVSAPTLPDCIGEFDTLKEAERRQWEITYLYGIDPENSDANPLRQPPAEETPE